MHPACHLAEATELGVVVGARLLREGRPGATNDAGQRAAVENPDPTHAIPATMSVMHPIIRAALDAGRGATTGSTLLRRGATRRDIERAVGAGELVRVRRNALVDGHRWREAKPWERHELRARAVVAALGGETPPALSHQSALAVRGVTLHGVDDRVHVACVGKGRGRTDAGLASHRPVAADLTVEHEGVLIVQPAVACLQVAIQFGGEAGLVSADDALRRQIISHDELDAAMTALRPGRWSREPARMLDLVDARSESAAESRTRWALRTLGFRMPTPQVVIHDADGDVVARVDFLYEDLKLIIEVDGMGKYATVEDLRAEKLREDRLRALGYHFVRLTWADLDDLRVLSAKVLRGVSLAA